MTDKPTTTGRGLGWSHQQERAAALARLIDGTPCPLCGHPMYRDQAPTLDLDHSTPRVLGGQGPRRLTHRRCNRAAGARLGNKRKRSRSKGSKPAPQSSPNYNNDRW